MKAREKIFYVLENSVPAFGSFRISEYLKIHASLARSSQVAAARIASVPSHCGGKPVCGFSQNLWWLNVRSGRRCDDFIDLPASIAVSSDKLDYDFMPRYNYVKEPCWLPIARKREEQVNITYVKQSFPRASR